MSDSQVLLCPSIFWKVDGLSETCHSIKGPEFTFLDEKWNLRFIYSGELKKGYVILQRYGDTAKNVSLEVSASYMLLEKEFFASKININLGSSTEYIIWQIADTDFTNYDNVISLFRVRSACLKFIINFRSNMPTPDVTKSTEGKTADYSPCIASLCHDFGNVFNNHLMSDVILQCEGMKMHSHRIVLAARSEVFAAMFRNDMKEATEKIVTIQGVEPSVLEQMIRYMYSGCILDLTPENVHKVYAAADRYGVDALKMRCGVFMVENPEGTITASTSSESGECSVNDAVLCHFANIKSLLRSDEWKKLAEREPKFAHAAFQFFLSKNF